MTATRPHRSAATTLRRSVASGLALSVGLLIAVSAPVGPAGAAPADGRTSTVGPLTLTVSQVADLDPAGQAVAVSGSGYDTAKGVYVALCVIPPPGVAPGPCGGGIDIAGQAGAAQWVSSNPPSYGVGLATPYGPGGSFSTSFAVRAELAPGIDCRQVRCAVVTRNDHTRSSDRSQDVLVPVSFRSSTPQAPGGGVGGGSAAAPPPGPAPAPTPVLPAPVPVDTTTTTTTTTAAPRTVTATADGLGVTDGVHTMSLSATSELDPEGDTVTVQGTGFDPARGVYVALCAVAPDPATAPSPCAGGPEASRWVTSAADDAGLAVAFGADGSFRVDLAVAAVIDGTTDCRTAACAVTVRADHTAADDRTLDLAVPVTFAAAPEADAADAVDGDERPAGTGERAVASEEAGGSGPAGAIAVAVVLVALVAAVASVLVVRRRRAGDAA